MTLTFTKAIKREAKLRLALIGPAGSGKTYTALAIASHLGQRIALMDTEHGSASKYADMFQFDAFAPDSFSPTIYIEAIQAAENAGYDVLILDSLSHAWAGKGGLLEFVDQEAKKNRGNSFGAWREATPLHNRLIDAMLAARLHLIVTMRSKMEYVVETDERGKTSVRKVGLQPVQRDGLEYEFDVTADLNLDNDLIISKTRCPALKGRIFPKAGQDVADVLMVWLSGEAAPTPAPMPKTTNGTGGKRAKLVARIGELLADAASLGDQAQVDPAWLDSASEAELTDYGKSLKAQVEALKAVRTDASPALREQAAMPLSE